MNNDPWLHVLQQIEPQYFALKDLVENGPRVFAELSRRGNWWVVTLQEELTPKPDLDPKYLNLGKLDERVDWSLKQLDTWPDVRRMAHDMWYFKRRRDAEKFQTIYNLKWASE